MKKLFTILITALSLNAFGQIPTAGLVGFYPFSGNANDVSGNSNHGTVIGASLTSDRFGNPNSAYSFSGDDTIIVPHSASLAFSTNAISVSYWLKENTYPVVSTHNQILISKQSGVGSTQNGFNVFQLGNSTHGMYVGANSVGGPTIAAPPLNQWHHVTLVYESGNCYGYYDGVLTSTSTTTSTLGLNTENLLIGASNWVYSNTFNYDGVLDDILFYNRSLTSAEVAQIYNNNCTADITTGLVAKYDFFGNANDLSGNSNNGTLMGPTLTTDRYGNANSAILFNGISDYVSLPSGNATSLNITGDYSLSFWIKTTDPSGLLTSLGDNVASPPNGAGYLTGINGGNVGNGKMGSATRGIWNGSSNDTLSDDLWHHIAISLKADTLSFYIDNQLDNQVTGVLAPLSWNGNRVIGCRNDLFMTSLANYEGVFDDLFIYNRALSSCDIDSLYNMPNPTATGIASPVNTASEYIYPNPAVDKIYLNIKTEADLMIFNYSGQLVKSIHNSNGQVDISDLNTGVYLLQVKSQDSSNISLHKLVKY